MNIDDYCDLARKRNNFTSDRALAIALKLNPTSVSFWRTKRAWPDDSTMIALADLADIKRERALIDLCLWRSTGTEAYSTYLKVADVLKKAVVFFAVIFATMLISNNETKAAQLDPGYYGNRAYVPIFCKHGRFYSEVQLSCNHRALRVVSADG